MRISTSDDSIVIFDHVTYTHLDQNAPTLCDLTLAIPRGSFTLLAGPSGAGKSTFCMLLNGIIPHLLGGELRGRVVVDGRDVAQTPVRELARSAGLLFQDPELMFATLQVEDEVAFGPENLCLAVNEVIARVDAALAYVDLLPQRKRLVWALSGGQAQKLGLAAVLAMRPPLVILDEPTANLDPATTHAVYELVLRLRREGTTVLLVTKELDEFMAEADQMIVLNEGRLLAQGPPRAVLERHGLEMIHELGIWLPEVTEIGLRLRARRAWPYAVPITVEEAAERMQEAGGRWQETGGGRQEAGDRESVADGKPRSEIQNPKSEIHADRVLVHATDVHYSYGPTPALRGVSFAIRRGELVAVVGQNGAGKSTLSKLLVGLLKPTRGELVLFGKPASRWRAQDLANQVALVFQNPEHQFLTDTVFDELAYSLLAQGIDDPQIVQERVTAMLERLDIAESSRAHPFALSAGAKRRLGVATMLVGGRPQLLIVDEPTYGQDKRMTTRLMELIQGLRADGITVIMITHDMRLVEAYAERAIVMTQGQILFDGSPIELFRRLEVMAAAALRPTALRRLIDTLNARGVPVPEDIHTVEEFVTRIDSLSRGMLGHWNIRTLEH